MDSPKDEEANEEQNEDIILNQNEDINPEEQDDADSIHQQAADNAEDVGSPWKMLEVHAAENDVLHAEENLEGKYDINPAEVDHSHVDENGENHVENEDTIQVTSNLGEQDAEEEEVDPSTLFAKCCFYQDDEMFFEGKLPLSAKLVDMQNLVAEELHLSDPNEISILFNGNVLHPNSSLLNIGICDGTTVGFEVHPNTTKVDAAAVEEKQVEMEAEENAITENVNPDQQDISDPQEETTAVEPSHLELEKGDTLLSTDSISHEDTPDIANQFANVIFYLNDDVLLEKRLSLATSFSDLIDSVIPHLPSDMNQLNILFNGNPLKPGNTLQNMGIFHNAKVGLEVAMSKLEIKEVNPSSKAETKNMSTDPMEAADDADAAVGFKSTSPGAAAKSISIERAYGRKPFLGGFRHKVTGVEYHHAGVQTLPPPRDVSLANRTTSTTQTSQLRHNTTQSYVTTSTQMTRPGVFVSTAQDRVVVPGRYETADEYLMKRELKVVTIQKYYRRWLAKRQVHQLRTAREARLNFEEDEQIRKEFDKQERIRREFQRRMNPKTRQDFDLLFNALEKWRCEQLASINDSDLTEAERRAALYVLLEQETELIHAIDRHQGNVTEENHEKLIQRLLGKAAAPKKFQSKKGDLIQMDTPYTLRGRELLEIYNSLQMKYLTQDERLDVLLTVKHTVKEHDCKLTQEIVELIDREVDLVMRGVKEDNLNGLRKRISNLFLQYCKTPTFNPEVARHLRVPQDPNELKNDIHYCRSCGRYLKSTEFLLGIKSTSLGRCKRCLRQDNLARHRQDLSAYKQILLELRKQEESYNDSGRIAFLVEEADIRYLVENIWESMSILSRSIELQELVLTRWRAAEQWSPWNSILLTRDEAEAHRKLANVNDAYGDMLRYRVRQKHVLAQNYFANLITMATAMNKSGSSGSGSSRGNYKNTQKSGLEVKVTLPPIRSTSGKV